MSILGSDKKKKNAKMEYYGILFTAATILKIALYETCNVRTSTDLVTLI